MSTFLGQKKVTTQNQDKQVHRGASLLKVCSKMNRSFRVLLAMSSYTEQSKVLILNGNSEHVAQAFRKKKNREKKIRFVAALDLIEFLKDVK